MTISSTSSKAIGRGNGVTTAFAYAFLIPSADLVRVSLVSAAGVITVLTPTQYSISGLGSDSGGTVTYPLAGSPIATGTSITVERLLTLVQATEIGNQSGYHPEVVEAALDYLTMLMQQLAGGALNYPLALTYPTVDVNPTTVLAPAGARANKFFAFDANGNPVFTAGTLSPDVSTNTVIATATVTARSLAKRFSEIANVKDWGAVGDGVTDDTLAIQAAIDSGILSIFFPTGTYKTTATLTVASGQDLYGPFDPSYFGLLSKTAIVCTVPGGSTYAITNKALAVGWSLRNMRVSVNNDSTKTCIGIVSSYAVQIKNVYLEPGFRTGIYLNDSYVCKLEDVTIISALGKKVYRYGIYLGAQNCTKIINFHSAVYVDAATCGVGIYVDQGKDCVIDGPTLQGWTIGIDLGVPQNTKIRDPYFENVMLDIRTGNENNGAVSKATVIDGGNFATGSAAHPQFATKAPLIYTPRTDQLTMITPNMLEAADALNGYGGILCHSSTGDINIIGGYGFSTGSTPYNNMIIYIKRTAVGASPNLNVSGGRYEAGTPYGARELAVKVDGAFGGQTSAIRVSNTQVVTAVDVTPPVIGVGVLNVLYTAAALNPIA